MRPLTFALASSGLTSALKEGHVDAGGRFDFVPVEQIVPHMRRMVRKLDYDICEMAITTYLCAKAAGIPITAIPVFVTRNFHHWAAFQNANAPIARPKDLEGRLVAVNRGYTVTTGLWVRGVLQEEYGVDLGKITWAPTDDEHVEQYRAPANVTYKYQGRPIADLLLAGEVTAAIGDVRSDAAVIKPLIADARGAGFAWFRRSGIYPINHTVVVQNALLAAEPGLAKTLLAAFTASKADYLRRLDAGSDLTPADKAVVDLRQVVGDPYPFGIAANRPALAALLRFAVDQHVLSKPFDLEQLFAPGAFEAA